MRGRRGEEEEGRRGGGKGEGSGEKGRRGEENLATPLHVFNRS